MDNQKQKLVATTVNTLKKTLKEKENRTKKSFPKKSDDHMNTPTYPKIVAIIQARISSTRLPGKVLMDIQNKTILEHVVERVRLAKCFQSSDNLVVVATSDQPQDDTIIAFLDGTNIPYFRGSEQDVLQRYYHAAKKHGAQLIIRICADQPLVDPKAIDLMIEKSKKTKEEYYDFTYCKHQLGWPDGTGCEIISWSALERAQQQCASSFEREHIQPFFLGHQQEFSINIVDAPASLYCPGLHLAVDTQDDFERIKNIYDRWYAQEKKEQKEPKATKEVIPLQAVVDHYKPSQIVMISNFTNFMKEATNITIASLAQELQKKGVVVSIFSPAGKERKEYQLAPESSQAAQDAEEKTGKGENIGKRARESQCINVIQHGFSGKKKWWNAAYLYHELMGLRKDLRREDLKEKDQKQASQESQSSNEGKKTILHHFSSSPLLALRGLLVANTAVKIHTMKSMPLKKGWQKSFFILNRYDAITVPLKTMKDALVQQGVKEEKIKVIRTNIDLGKFIPQNKEKIRGRYAIEKAQKILLYYGAMRKEKGIHHLIQALPQVLKTYPETKLIIASRARLQDRNDNKTIEEIKADILNDIGVVQLGLQKSVELHVENVDVTDYLNLADAVVLAYPTLEGTEGNPSCVLEAMACKTPVVTTNLPQLREILEPDVHAIMAKPDDIQDLAMQIVRLLADKKLQQKIIDNAYEKVQEFSVKKIAEEFMALYVQEMVKKH